MKKKLFLILFFTLLVFPVCKTSFAADIKYVYKNESELTKGVTYTSYEVFMSDRRWNNVYVAQADLNYPHLSLQAAWSEDGSGYLFDITKRAKATDSLVMINADFFSRSSVSGRGSPIGAIYFKDKMASSPSTDGKMYTIMQDTGRNVFADIVDYALTVVAPNGEEKQIAGKNKASDLSQIMMYDNGYDKYSLGSTETLYEVVVKNDQISEIRFSSEPVELLDDMYVLCGLSDHDTFLLDNFKVGDKIEIEETSNIDFSSLNLAIGAGAKLVDEGEVVKDFSHVISGNNPRTALGISKNKRTVYFVVVDGRSSISSGMSMSELAEFMHYIGSHNAVNLDGGGSSAMTIKELKNGSQKLVNTPSEGSVRKVASALSIVSSVKKASSLYHLKLTADGENVFKGTGIDLNVEGFDEHYFPVSINKDKISYSVSGVKGYFENNTFFPTSSGIATITARMPNGSNASVQLRVLDTAYKIVSTKRSVELDVGKKEEILLSVYDEKGYNANVALSDMKVNFSQNIAHIDGNTIIADKQGSALMSAKFGDAVIYMSVYVGEKKDIIPLPTDKTAQDTQNKTGQPTNDNAKTSFAVFGKLRESDTLFNNLVMKKSLSKINLDAHQAFLLSTHATKNIEANMTIPVQICYPFRSFTEGDNKYIILDTEDNFMSAKEWTWFIDETKSTNNKNLFVFMQTEPTFVSARETKLLKDILSGVAERGVNVYVFSAGNDTVMESENGVKYIKTSGFSDDIKASGFASSRSKLKYVLVEIDKNNDISYRFVDVY